MSSETSLPKLTSETKRCSKCGEDKPRTEFHRHSRNKDGLSGWCKVCARKGIKAAHAKRPEYYRDWHKTYADANKGRKRERSLERKYGLMPGDFEAMLAAQSGGCAICGTPDPGGKGYFNVDHCHMTGAVRGILCHFCNVSLGGFKDIPAILRRAADYLEKHQSA